MNMCVYVYVGYFMCIYAKQHVIYYYCPILQLRKKITETKQHTKGARSFTGAYTGTATKVPGVQSLHSAESQTGVKGLLCNCVARPGAQIG